MMSILNHVKCKLGWIGAAFLVCLLMSVSGYAVRIKDIASLKGTRGNQLVGYGLVVGLDGTGDSGDSVFTIQSLAAMLEQSEPSP